MPPPRARPPALDAPPPYPPHATRSDQRGVHTTPADPAAPSSGHVQPATRRLHLEALIVEQAAGARRRRRARTLNDLGQSAAAARGARRRGGALRAANAERLLLELEHNIIFFISERAPRARTAAEAPVSGIGCCLAARYRRQPPESWSSLLALATHSNVSQTPRVIFGSYASSTLVTPATLRAAARSLSK